MPSHDPFYKTRAWQATSRATLIRDGYRCRAPGCTAKAIGAHHYPRRVVLMARGLSPLDTTYTYSLCAACHGRADATTDGSIVAAPGDMKRGGNRFMATVMHKR